MSPEEKTRIINPPALASINFADWYKWPTGKPVPGPSACPTKSFWIEEFTHDFDHMQSGPELPLSADIVIIGSGITGCSAAYHIVKQNPELRIVICEARGFCTGATGRNGGHCFRPEGWSFRELVERLGPQAALEERRFFLKNRDMMQATIDDLQIRDRIDCVFEGGVHLFGSEEERLGHIADLRLADELGLEHGSEVKSASEISEIIQCFNEYGGLFSRRSGSFWPRKFCAAILEHAMERGHVSLQTNTAVIDITPTTEPGMRWIVGTTRGRMNTKAVLHATNGWASSLLPELMGTEHEVVPARCMVVAARPQPSSNSRGTWAVNVLAREGYHWLVQMPQKAGDSQENAVIYGLHGSGPSADDATLLEDSEGPLDDYRRFLHFVFPEKFSVADDRGRIPAERLEYKWTGIIGLTRNEKVILGPLKGKRGQFTSVGYNGAGMVKCWGSGCVVADMILWELDRYESIRSQAEPTAWKAPAWYPGHYLQNLDILGDL